MKCDFAYVLLGVFKKCYQFHSLIDFIIDGFEKSTKYYRDWTKNNVTGPEIGH